MSDPDPEDSRFKARPIDKMAWWFLVISVGAVVVIALNTLYISRQSTAQKKPISYTGIVIERVDEEGLLSIPKVVGFDEPAVCTNQDVPVRVLRDNNTKANIEILSEFYVWAEDPPGERFRQPFDRPITAKPGTEQIYYENEIPPVVQQYVNDTGPTRFAISGVVQVLEPDAVGAIWETPSFLIVPEEMCP